MAGFSNEYESDLSDEEEGVQEVTEWLDEEDPEEEEVVVKPAPILPPKIDIVHKSEYIVQNLDLFYALCELEDVEFEKYSDNQQEELMKTLVVDEYRPGESIIVEGDTGNELYIIIATEKTADRAEVEVVNQNILAGTEVFLTRLHRGQFFGQKFFVTRRVNKRGATVRVPHDSPINVQVATLSMEHFDKWENFRNLLLVKTVPLIQKVPRKERSTILQHMQIREFKDGDYIIKQGEKGEDFFIIQEGSVKVVETRPSHDKDGPPQDVVLVTLREGHFFGEMSLVTDEPRVASVISIKTTICLSLSKSVFRSALSDETFTEVMEVLSKRKEIRKQREKEQEENPSSSSAASSQHSLPIRRMSYRNRTQSGISEVTVSSTLSMRKLESGTKVINKYIVERELGKGSFGEVYLCRDQDTDEVYAMKQIIRPSTGWNDEASNAIRQEIAVMKRLKHQNVVGLNEVIDDQNARKIFLIQEFMEGGPLMGDCESCTPIDQALARKYFRDIARGVCYLHSEGIIHRDIKPQNMLLSGDGVVKIADFGAAVFTGAQQKVAFGGTPAFMAPELFLTSKEDDFTKSPGIDIFALGATLYFLVVGRPPWMARNQIDLATKIKNIELVFPKEGLDPHLKHLLRQMLAKDYRLRCNLDTIVVDDWVTFEGSDPLFEKDEYLVHEFESFQAVLDLEDPGPPPLKILIVNPSLVTRTMLHNQINNAQSAICVCATNGDEAAHIVRSAMESHPQANFDYIFCELLLPTKRDGLATIAAIRQSGFQGKIVGMTASRSTGRNGAEAGGQAADVGPADEDLDEFLREDGADALVRRPIANRELTMLLTKANFEQIADTMLHKTHGAPPVDKITAEEFDNAITFNVATRSASMRTMSFSDAGSVPLSLSLAKGDTDADADADADGDADDLDGENVQDFDTFSSGPSPRGRGGHHRPRAETDSPDMELSRLNLLDKGGLMRKRAFMVVPYGAQAPGSPADPAAVFDRPLNILDIREDLKDRKFRREQAMKHSKLAQQYRQAKREGDTQKVHSSKSLLNLLKSQSKKSMMPKHGLLAGPGGASGASPAGAAGEDPGSSSYGGSQSSAGGAGAAERRSVPEVSMKDVDLFIGNTIEHGDGDDLDEESEPDNLEDTDPEEESILDDSSSDDDFGIGADEIKQLDNDAFEEEFSKLIRKKSSNDNAELAEWNHTLVGVDLRCMVKHDESNYNGTLKVAYGMADSVVSRSYMEDRSYGCVQFAERLQEKRPALAMFAVFDGHNGEYVAALLKEKYAPTFASMLREFEDSHPNFGHGRHGYEANHYENKIAHIYERTNALLDREVLERDFQRQQKNLHSGIQDLQTYAGSVAVVAAVLPAFHPHGGLHQHHGVHVFVSHVGDCRAVLSHDGIAVQLTEDHKANLKAEKARIEAAGGWVHNCRVNGALGVSRSFGDIQFKNFEPCLGHDGDEMESRGIWGMHQQVVSKPDFKHFFVEDSYEFMVLASDGLWDVFSCQEAVNFVRKKLLLHNNIPEVAQMLIDKAIERGTQDNTSVIIVAFHQ